MSPGAGHDGGAGPGPGDDEGAGAGRPGRWRRIRDLLLRYGPVPVLLTGVGNVVVEAVSDSVFGRWGWAAVLVLALAWALLAVVSWLVDGPGPAGEEPDPQPARTQPLPPPVALLDREPLLDAVVEQAHKHGLVVVHGPSGMGVSAVAVEAARRLAPVPGLQEYVDLRGQNPGRPDSPRRVAIRVLTVLGLRPGRIPDLDAAAEKVREALRDSGRVLLLDNVTQAAQVGWLPQHVPGAFLVLAGDIPGSALAGRADVAVGPPDPAAALLLLGSQDPGDQPGPDVAARVAAEPELARQLAEGYLRQPRAAIEIGKWLAANPEISVRHLLEDLRRHGEPSAAGRYILRQLLAGASPRARRLLADLAAVPVAEVPEAAVAALAEEPVRHVAVLLDELVERRLVVRTRPARYRLQDDARALAETLPGAGPDALVRSLGYYARRATESAAALRAAPGSAELAAAEAWLAAEDTALLQLLGVPEPPERAATLLWQVAEVLELWFVRENRPTDRRAAAEAMAAAARALGDVEARETALYRLLALARLDGDVAAAERYLGEAHRLHGEAAASGRGRPAFHTNVGLHLLARGRLGEAHAEFRRSARRRPRRDEAGRVVDLTNLGAVLLRQDRLPEADARLSEALAAAQDSADVGGQAHAQELLGVVAFRRHNPAQAAKLWAAARLRYEQGGDDPGQARCLLHTATALRATGGAPAEAVAGLLRQSLDLRGSQEYGVGVALTHLYLGEVAGADGCPDDVRRHREAGLAALRGADQPAPEPAEVTAVRERLAGLGDGVPQVG